MNRKLLITLGMCCFLTACSMGTNKSEQSESVSSTQSINSIESSNITSQSEISKEPENRMFDISSLNGKTYYKYYTGDNEVRIPGVELPYTYTIPEYAEASSWMMFYGLKVKDGKVYETHLVDEKSENIVTYHLGEKEILLTILENRYFTEYGEIIFSEDMIYLAGDFYVSDEYVNTNSIVIVTIENQHKTWIAEGAIAKAQQILETYKETLGTSLNNAKEITLPNKLIVKEENPLIEVLVSYTNVTPADDYELDGYVLKRKTDNRPYCHLSVTLSYGEETTSYTYYF